MDEGASARVPAHGAERFLYPNIAKIARVLGTITQPTKNFARLRAGVERVIGITAGPAIDKTAATQHNSIMHVQFPAEPIVSQLGRAVLMLEGQTKRVLGRAQVVATGVSVHLHSAARRKLRL